MVKTKIDDGGSAFPYQYEYDGIPVVCPGMTLRDWFAGQALASMVHKFPENIIWSNVAFEAYEAADAMLAARKGDAE
jgi:hypothetical protein